MIYFLSFIFIISLPIFLHELGHFLAARSVGIKVEKFYFGFNFFGLGIKKKYKETEYGIGLFPLGGYVNTIITDTHSLLRVSWFFLLTVAPWRKCASTWCGSISTKAKL